MTHQEKFACRPQIRLSWYRRWFVVTNYITLSLHSITNVFQSNTFRIQACNIKFLYRLDLAWACVPEWSEEAPALQCIASTCCPHMHKQDETSTSISPTQCPHTYYVSLGFTRDRGSATLRISNLFFTSHRCRGVTIECEIVIITYRDIKWHK